ncbi:MAG TPA: helix-turn-helix transcriptional regulator [Thermoanaerobaculia bacterium]|jgi:AcrR family transcriptional regulator
MKAEEEDEGPIQEETRHLIELIRVLARTLGFNNAALARRAKVPLASLVRYFKGEGEPKVEFLLAVVRALGLEVREFFEIAYPEATAPSPARLRIDKILGPIRPGKVLGPLPKAEPEPAVPLRREDMEEMLEQFRRDVRELLEERAKGERAAAELERRPVRKKSAR